MPHAAKPGVTGRTEGPQAAARHQRSITERPGQQTHSKFPVLAGTEDSGGNANPLFRTKMYFFLREGTRAATGPALTDASGPLLVGVVASAARQRVPLAGVRPDGVDAVESWFTRLRERCAFINIW